MRSLCFLGIALAISLASYIQDRIRIETALFASPDPMATQPEKTLTEGQKKHLEEAEKIVSQAKEHCRRGEYSDAILLTEKLVEIRRNSLGESHPLYAEGLNELGRLFLEIGQTAKAEPVFLQALDIRKRVSGDNHPEYAETLNYLARLYQDSGQADKAEKLLWQALEVRKRVLGEDHAIYGESLNNIGVFYQNNGQAPKAEPFLTQSLEIVRKTQGENNPNYAHCLNNLARLYHDMGQLSKAEILYKTSLESRARAFGINSRYYAQSLNNLGLLYKDIGKASLAESNFKQAMDISKRLLGESHPDYAKILNNLGLLFLEDNKPVESREVLSQVVQSARANLDLLGDGQSENAQRAYLRTKRHYLDNFLSACLAGRQNSYDTVLEWKGSLFSRQHRQRVFAIKDPEAREIQNRLKDSSSSLGRLHNSFPKPEESQAYREKLAELSRRHSELEVELSRRSAAFAKAKGRSITNSKDLAGYLPSNSAFIDFLEYDQYLPSEKGDTTGRSSMDAFITMMEKMGRENTRPSLSVKPVYNRKRRYLAWIVRQGIPAVQLELGDARIINQAIADWRSGIKGRKAPIQGERDPASTLRDQILAPLLPHLGGVETILVSPDSDLGTLSFAALPGRNNGKYLIEEMAVVVIPFAQALPDILGPWQSSRENRLLVLGEVDYGADPGKPSLGPGLVARRGTRFARYDPLPETRAELASVRDSFEQRFPQGFSRQLRRDQATEDSLRIEASAARWLHLATHGFFAAGKDNPQAKPERLSRDESFLEVPISNGSQLDKEFPGLLSGLVLAGANNPLSLEKNDGILTAAEVQEMDLSGVELATLSACETGLGQSAGGEGLLGLQRAFHLAGCRTVVASLWQVPDKATKELMTRFYENLWDRKMPKGQALREAQLYLLQERKDFRGLEPAMTAEGPAKAYVTPPLYWAAWSLSGAWR